MIMNASHNELQHQIMCMVQGEAHTSKKVDLAACNIHGHENAPSSFES